MPASGISTARPGPAGRPRASSASRTTGTCSTAATGSNSRTRPTGPAVKARNAKGGRPTSRRGGREVVHHRFPGRQDGGVHPGAQGPAVLLHGEPSRPARPQHGAPALRHDVRGLNFSSRVAFERARAASCRAAGEAELREHDAATSAWSSASTTTSARSSTALRAAGVLDNTIVVFTADHGDMCGEHGRVNKGIPLEGSARIPFLIAYPGRIKPGTVVHEALANVDFKPTLWACWACRATAGRRPRCLGAVSARAKAPAGLEERDLLPQCRRHG